ncbi:MAG: hypothetical protein KJN71_00085 [Acidimicrobiia bacterium]|nr:hypothetical protein [Acidimicrobiia bacterium]NNC75971.1 hypothetical protein [Acidimicrobiia bacterium]
MTLFWQALFVVGAIALAFWITGITARRLGSRPRAPLPDGVVLVVGPGCVNCDEAERALVASGAHVTIVDVSDKRLDPFRIATVPAGLAVVAGDVAMRRVGQAVIDDAARLNAATQGETD